MLQIIFKTFFMFLLVVPFTYGTTPAPEMRMPLNKLFSHKNHKSVLKSASLNCIECHNFSVKSKTGADPLSTNIEAGHLTISRQVCHECHMGKVEVPRVNQCSLCHLRPERLKPESHILGWKERHGSFAQMNPNSCSSCHQENQNSCANCHSQRNTLKHSVHRANFRMTHAIEARTKPASCVTCHSNQNICLDCHRGGISR